MNDTGINLDSRNDGDTPETATGRLERWQGNLLDLTLRNRLLNFGERVSTIQLLCPDPEGLLNRLADDASIQIQEWPEQDELDRAVCERALAQNAVYARLVKSGQRRDLQSRLLELSRKARRDLQEGGANTLFLVVDFSSGSRLKQATESSLRR